MPSWSVTQPEHLDFDRGVRELDVSLVAGRLSVVGMDGPARVEVNSTGEVPVNVIYEDGRLSVAHPFPKTWPGMLQPLWWWLNGGRKMQSDISIAVPLASTGTLRVSSGSVVASNVHGDLTVECVSGRITLLGVAGKIRAKVVSGPIEALGCAGDIAVETISGEVTLADSATDQVRAKTVSGAITADLDNPPENSEINLETASGEITIRVREDSDLAVHLSAAHGRVTTAFPSLAVEGRWGSSVRGALGAGTGQLNAKAIGGNISLLCRPVDDDFTEDRR